MNKSSIISLINDTEKITKEDNIFLKEITDKYPFFSIGHILCQHLYTQFEDFYFVKAPGVLFFR